MTRKDFVTVAQTIAKLPENTTRDEVAQAFCDILSTHSPFFDGAKFLSAATPEA